MNRRPRIFSTQPLDDYATGVLGRYGDFVVASEPTEAALIEEIADAIALVVRGAAPVTAAVLRAAPNLRVIGRTGVGYDTIDIAAATARRVPVVYTPGAGARAVAEAALGLMLALCKMLPFWDAQLKAGHWKARYTHQGRDLDGKTLGIIGLGRIGRLVAAMARPFDMTVIAYDPYLDPARAAELDVKLLSLEELLRSADFISLHCPLTDETRSMIDRKRLAQVKPGAYLINLARGGVIQDLDVLYEALQFGSLGGVGLDVFEPAPPDITHPIFKLHNCITSPHALATTEVAMARILKSMADDMAAVLDGRPPQFVVNPEALG